ncbi:Fic family protein [Candidatus Dependentiae bacterium]|nr:Fic family protein [Candidatus Dependentiae bacterium]
MKLEKFISGGFIEQYQYKSFIPEKIDHVWTWDDPQINVLLENANKVLGELNAFSLIVPDIDLFIHMHVLKEAQASSKIEGTKTEIDEVLLDKEVISPEKRDDWVEVQNYISAMNHGVERLNEIPLSNRLLKEMHEILLSGARGENKLPGEFRESQNWIGGNSLSDAVFIPPPKEDVPRLMGDLEKFLHHKDLNVPHLIKAAISHYQFETIHPFLDGNGRIGRLLITFYFVSNEILEKPCLYISDYFEKNKAMYYDLLTLTRKKNDLKSWITFFLNGIIQTASKGRDAFKKILELRNNVEIKIQKLNRKSIKGKILIDYLYKKPIIGLNDVQKIFNSTKPTANSLIKDFIRLNILFEFTGNKRNRRYVFKDYFNLFLK